MKTKIKVNKKKNLNSHTNKNYRERIFMEKCSRNERRIVERVKEELVKE